MAFFILILLTLLFSAFFSGMEIAYISANKLKLELDKKSEPFQSRLLRLATNESGQYIATMLVGNNIALVIYGIAFARLMEPWLEHFISSGSLIFIIQTIVSSLIILLLAEFLPKTLFRIFPNFFLNIFAFPLAFFYIVFYPISQFSMGITNILLVKIFKTKLKPNEDNPVFSRVDLDHFINNPENSEVLHDPEIEQSVRMFKNALDFSKIKIREVMVPRTEMEVLDINNADIDQLKQRFIETGFSRILFYENHIDNIIGYVHSAIIFNSPSSIRPYLKNVMTIPETMPANKLLSTFIQEHLSIAVVVDEFGGTAGIVTTEDILEEIFGEIEDEHDTSDFIEKKINENEFILSGRFEIDFLNEKYNLNIPETEEFETLAGFILFHYESIPKINSIIQIENYTIKILKASNTKIELVHLTIKK